MLSKSKVIIEYNIFLWELKSSNFKFSEHHYDCSPLYAERFF